MSHELTNYLSIFNLIVSPPLKLGGFLFLNFRQRGGHEIGAGSLRKGGGPNYFISFFSEEHVFITIGIHFYILHFYILLEYIHTFYVNIQAYCNQ